jgi:hypothetical protein
VRLIEAPAVSRAAPAIRIVVSDEVHFEARVRPQVAVLAASVERVNGALTRADSGDADWESAFERELDDWVRLAVAIGEAGPPGRLKPVRDALLDGLGHGRVTAQLLRDASAAANPALLEEANARLTEARSAFTRAGEQDAAFAGIPTLRAIPSGALERRAAPRVAATLPNVDALEIRNVSAFPGVTGAAHLVGEVRNNGGFAYGQPLVTAEFRDRDGRVLAVTNAYLRAASLEPGQVAPFHLVWEQGTPGAWFTLAANGSAFTGSPTPTPPSIQIEREEATTQPMGETVVTGTLRNTGSAPAGVLEVVGTFYDKSGRVRRVATAPASTRLSPGETAEFRLVVADGAGAGIHGYRLRVEAQQPAQSGQ